MEQWVGFVLVGDHEIKVTSGGAWSGAEKPEFSVRRQWNAERNQNVLVDEEGAVVEPHQISQRALTPLFFG